MVSFLHNFSSENLSANARTHKCTNGKMPSRLRAFTHSHLHAFTHSCLRAFTPSRLRAFMPSRLRAFTPSHIRAFTPSRLHATFSFTLTVWIFVLFSSCTAPFDMKPSHSEPVIVIFGYLTENVEFQAIRITTSSPYFEMQPNQPVSKAIVSIRSSENQTFELVETADKGVYCTRYPMAAVAGTTYYLSVQADIHKKGNLQLYEATTTMPRKFVLDTIAISTMTIMGFKHYNLKVYAQEVPGPDYYYARAIINDSLSSSRISRAIVFSDYGIDGIYWDGLPMMQFEDSENEYFSNRENETTYNVVKPGDKITFCISLIERGFRDFVEQAQRERRGENPFFGGPASNITTNISNGGVGYFTSFCTTKMEVYVP